MEKRMKWIALVMLAVFSSNVSAQDSQTYDSYMACLAKKVPDFDDGISDATTVARSLRSSCVPELNALVNEMSKRMTIGQLKSLDVRAAEIQTECSIRAVLTARVAQRKLRATARSSKPN